MWQEHIKTIGYWLLAIIIVVLFGIKSEKWVENCYKNNGYIEMINSKKFKCEEVIDGRIKTDTPEEFRDLNNP